VTGRELHFDGDVAIVTGAGRGLGREHALELARRGARVIVNDRGGSVDGDGADASPAGAVCEEIRRAGGTAVPNLDDVASVAGGEALVGQALDEFGRVDIVVNNAGIVRDRAFHKMDAEEMEAVVAVHLQGAFNVTRPAWPHMREQGYGRVVNTTSASGLFGNFGQANYGAAKAGLLGLTRVLAIEGRKSGIRVNAVAPAAATRMNEEMLGERAGLLEPRHVAPVVAFLAHRDCDLVGQVLSAGGGHVAAVLLSVTAGITEVELSAESVRDHLSEILDPAEATYPRHIGDDLGGLLAKVEAARPLMEARAE
jgi:NAD(P)-dependent dehydrogenase (short-subunit alcohol dehydrogenase family)